MADVRQVCCAWARLKYVTPYCWALAVIENSGDASAAEARTTLKHQQRRLSTWVSDSLRSNERTTQLLIYSPRVPGLFCALQQGTLLFMIYGARPICPHLGPQNSLNYARAVRASSRGSA